MNSSHRMFSFTFGSKFPAQTVASWLRSQREGIMDIVLCTSLIIIYYIQNNQPYNQMSREREEVEKDIAEIKQFILTSRRQSNRMAMAKILSALKNQLQGTGSAPKPDEPIPVIVPEEPPKDPVDKIKLTPLTKYSWDQVGKKIKIYLLLDDIGNQCAGNQIQVKFGTQEFEAKIFGYKEGNYIFGIKKLAGKIDAAHSTYSVKKNSLILTLLKQQEEKHWTDIYYKETQFTEASKKSEEKEPGAKMMRMLKQMYEDGDDEVRKEIEEGWKKAQDPKSMDEIINRPPIPGVTRMKLGDTFW